jgi:hypothetical protein
VEWCAVAQIGPRAQGLADDDAEVMLLGIWIAPTPALLKVQPPESTWRREGSVMGIDVTLDAVEIGEAMRRLLTGDSRQLDALLSHRNVVTSELHEHLLERARDGLHRGHVDDYLRRANETLELGTAAAHRAASALLLQADHLQRTGLVSTDAVELARATGRSHRLGDDLDRDEIDSWIQAVRGGAAAGLLPAEHPRPTALDELLLYVREARW